MTYFLFWKWESNDGSHGAGLSNFNTLDEAKEERKEFLFDFREVRTAVVIIQGEEINPYEDSELKLS